ncbi:hypothetical protein DNTS_034560 [Danionella cerebrum]|uniref:MMS19 nucleotide excision repair protein n=1 Tax=Danionella cerebrum TaxID=2873325 RepID=A0A553RE36_9TELE|nr:hypothetical protein DNTS_034560 [Danionella translucida]
MVAVCACAVINWLRFSMAAENSALLGLVEEFVSGQVDSKATETAEGLKNGHFTVLQLVEALGFSLISSQPQTRGRGVQLLSLVLQECYSSLSEKEVEVLLAFYENRLKDHYVITPHVLKGLQALAKCSVLPPGSAVSILKSIFQDVHVQSLMLAERSSVYSILISLMDSREEELKSLGADFIFGFVQSVDGERDPRNLLLAFQVARNIIYRGYDLGKFVEELFEVTSCYFPIDFSPPPNDPHGITQEELVLSLRAVLTGTLQFAEFLLPLLVEKLDSDVQSAKIDSLQTLAACGQIYSHRELGAFLPGLWSSIRREVFQTASERVESAGLSALSSLVSCLSRSVLDSNSEDSLEVFLNLVLKDCRHHLCEPDLKLVWPSARLLQAAAGASYRSSLIMAQLVLPLLLEQYSSSTQGFVQPTELSRPAEGEESVLVGFRESLCSSVFSALSESSAGLQLTASRADVEKAVDHLTRLVLDEEDAQLSSVRRAPAVCGSFGMGLVSPQCGAGELSGSSAGNGGFSVEDVCTVCVGLQRIAQQARDDEEIGRFFHENIIPRLLGLALQAALGSKDSGSCISPLADEAVLFALVPVASTACAALQTQAASSMAAQTVALFLDGDVSFLPENAFPSQVQLLQADSRGPSQLVCLLMACVCSLPRSVEIPELERLLLRLEDLSCSSPHLFSYTHASKCFAALLFSLLSDAELGSEVAEGFRVLMSDSPDVLNRECHADVRIMYRQRFFHENSSKLVQGFNSAEQEKKSHYLKALSHIVNNLPRQVQLTELPALLPLLLEALCCPDQGVQLSTLCCLQPVLLESPAALGSQLEALVSRLLALSSSPAMKVRITSLSCVHALARLPEALVLPFRARVLKALSAPLDDKKRLVRKEAVAARGEWFLLGSPGGR